MNKNRINGQKLEFGNREQIDFVRRNDRIFSEKEAFHEIEWKFCIYLGHIGPTQKPRFKYAEWNRNADAVVDHIPCPKCSRIHILLITFDPNGHLYEEILRIDRHTENGFHCWNCKTEFKAEDRYIFVKKQA